MKVHHVTAKTHPGHRLSACGGPCPPTPPHAARPPPPPPHTHTHGTAHTPLGDGCGDVRERERMGVEMRERERLEVEMRERERKKERERKRE